MEMSNLSMKMKFDQSVCFLLRILIYFYGQDDTKIKAVVIIQKPRGSMLLYYSAIAYALHLKTIRRANLSKSYSLRV
ncbi:hypothetical protein NC652_037133 [Populus alba x Populus x berolinensis]|nr:hypothetical protein NC652_037133 [Populus alba x Populus x berolinensis]